MEPLFSPDKENKLSKGDSYKGDDFARNTFGCDWHETIPPLNPKGVNCIVFKKMHSRECIQSLLCNPDFPVSDPRTGWRKV